MTAESSAEQAMQRPVVSGVSVRQRGQTMDSQQRGRPRMASGVIILPGEPQSKYN